MKNLPFKRQRHVCTLQIQSLAKSFNVHNESDGSGWKGGRTHSTSSSCQSFRGLR